MGLNRLSIDSISDFVLTPEIAAALFDAHGRVIWRVVRKSRMTLTGIQISGMSIKMCKTFIETFRGGIYYHKNRALWQIHGRDSELFADRILEHSSKRELLLLYLQARQQIGAQGVGKKARLLESHLDLREALGLQIRMLQDSYNVTSPPSKGE